MDQDRDLDRLKRHAAELAEHFDTVQIFTTRHDGESGKTYQWQNGVGNWYARYGGMKKWLQDEDGAPDCTGEEIEGDD